MKAQVLHKYDPEMKEGTWVTNQEMPDPKIEKASDVIVKIGAAGVCRTDLHIIEGVWKHIQDPDGKLLPCVMGHENAGWIEDVGKDVTEFKKGDPVILHPLISGTDGTCLDCRRGNDMHAAAGAFPGLSIKEGGYSELLKTSVRNLIKLPTVLAPKDVAPFSDAGLTAYRVVKKATRHLLPGQSCTIIGAGGLGHIAIQCLKAMCAADIIIVEKSEKGATSFGAKTFGNLIKFLTLVFKSSEYPPSLILNPGNAPAAACISLPLLQSKHVPSVPEIKGCKITGSPFLNSVTSFPTSSIQPAFSWPITQGSNFPSGS